MYHFELPDNGGEHSPHKTRALEAEEMVWRIILWETVSLASFFTLWREDERENRATALVLSCSHREHCLPPAIVYMVSTCTFRCTMWSSKSTDKWQRKGLTDVTDFCPRHTTAQYNAVFFMSE